MLLQQNQNFYRGILLFLKTKSFSDKEIYLLKVALSSIYYFSLATDLYPNEEIDSYIS